MTIIKQDWFCYLIHRKEDGRFSYTVWQDEEHSNCKENKLKGYRTGNYQTRESGALAAGLNDGRSVRLQRDVSGVAIKRLGAG